MVTEAKLQAKVIAWAIQQGITPIRMSFRPGTAVGWPDVLFLSSRSRVVFIEFKAPGKKPTPLQLHRLEKLRDLGFTAEWCDAFDKACTVLSSAMGPASLHGASGGVLENAPGGGPTAPAGRAQD